MKLHHKVGAVVLFFACMSGCCCPATTSQQGASGDDSGSSIFPEAIVDQDAYDRIHEGMSYSQVVDIIGARGEERSSNGLAGIVTKLYEWKNWDGSNMNAIFQDGRLVSKAQYGLKPESAAKAKRKAEARKREEEGRQAEERRRREAAIAADRERAQKAKEQAEREERERPAREAAAKKEAAERAKREEIERPERERKQREREAAGAEVRQQQDEDDARTLLRLAKNEGNAERRRKALEALIKQFPKTKAADQARELLKGGNP